MKIVVLVINDGRNDYLEQTLKSFKKNVVMPPEAEVFTLLIDDMPEGRNENEIQDIVKKYEINKAILNEENLGINAVVQLAWQAISVLKPDYIFHQENDFVYNHTIDVQRMISALECNQRIGQVALRRQPWFEDELKANTLYKDLNYYRAVNIAGHELVFQKEYFTHNPCIYRAKHAVQIHGYNEYAYAKYLLKNGIMTFAYMGKLDTPPHVTHIGYIKKGHE